MSMIPCYGLSQDMEAFVHALLVFYSMSLNMFLTLNSGELVAYLNMSYSI